MSYPLRDPSLPHQVVIYMHGSQIAVSCNCRASRKRGVSGPVHYKPIEKRYTWPSVDALLAAYETWHLLRGVTAA